MNITVKRPINYILMSLFTIIPATSYSSTLVSRAVPSAQQSLTSEFGMGSGGTSALSSPEKLEWIVIKDIDYLYDQRK